jgi:hypothetical protein
MRFRTSVAVAIGVAVAGITVAASSPAAMAAPQTAPQAAPQAARGVRACAEAQLRYSLGGRYGSPAQRIQVVRLTNRGWSACTLTGFPGVELVGKALGTRNYRWSLDWQRAHYATVTLRPGRTAHFDLIYLPFASGDGIDIAVREIVITPPNDFRHAALTWHQQVLLQDAATHPGTYVSPVRPGA